MSRDPSVCPTISIKIGTSLEVILTTGISRMTFLGSDCSAHEARKRTRKKSRLHLVAVDMVNPIFLIILIFRILLHLLPDQLPRRCNNQAG